MKLASRRILLGIGLVFLLTSLCGQTIWPGDVNNNGIVNGVDLLYVGLAYGSTGPQRQNASTGWEEQPITALWAQSFPDGINYAYADADGDGEIDDDDLDAIEENYLQTHGTPLPEDYRSGLPGIDPPLGLQPAAAVVQPGDNTGVELSLGTAEQPVFDFYGMSLAFSFDAELADNDDDDDEEIEFETAENAWINPPNRENAEVRLLLDGNSGRGELAVTRTDQQPVNEGFGSLGRFTIVIEDIIVGLQVDTFDLRLDSVRLIDDRLNTTAIVLNEASFLVTSDPGLITSTAVVTAESIALEVFPNPSKATYLLRSDQPVDRVELQTLMGRSVAASVERLGGNTLAVHPRACPPGLYLLLVFTREGMAVARVLWTPD